MREANQTDTQDKKALFRQVQAAKLQRAEVEERIRKESGEYMSPRNRLRHLAMKAAQRAIRNGILIKQPCEVCGVGVDAKLKHGRPLVQAHHDDYRFPLCVRWLCMPHHRSWHAYNLTTDATDDMLGMGANDLFWLGIEQLGLSESETLRTRLAKAEAEANTAKDEVRLSQKREADARKLMAELKQKIETLEGKAPIVTEHALLRYFERVLGYDLDAVSRGLLTEQAVAMIAVMPNGKIPSVGCRLVVKDGVVVTIEA